MYTDQKGNKQTNKKQKTIVKVMINTRNSQKTNMKMLKRGFQNHKMWGRKVRISRLFFFLRPKQAHIRKGLTYLKNRATTNQNQKIHSKNKQTKKGNKYKIKGNHPTKKRQEQRRNIKSTGKQGLK